MRGICVLKAKVPALKTALPMELVKGKETTVADTNISSPTLVLGRLVRDNSPLAPLKKKLPGDFSTTKPS